MSDISKIKTDSEIKQTANNSARPGNTYSRILPYIVVLILWFIIYRYLQPVAKYITFDIFNFSPETRLGKSVEFFLYDTPKVLMLLILIVFGVGIIRTFFTQERTRQILAGKRESLGNLFAGLLGIVTPFCSCSAVPLFIGFVETGVPLGVTLTFLIAAPLINEVAAVLLLGMFGWKVALIYVSTGLAIAIISGWIIGRLRLERYIESWVHEIKIANVDTTNEKLSWANRIEAGKIAVKEIVGKVWPYVIAGIAVGAAIHGYVPENFMASIMSKNHWWSIPVAVVIGVPMYSNAAGIIPIVQALLEKGVPLGTALAFMMAVIGLSLPETIILRKVLRPQLIGVFLGVVAIGIMIVGYIFNMIF